MILYWNPPSTFPSLLFDHTFLLSTAVLWMHVPQHAPRECERTSALPVEIKPSLAGSKAMHT